MATDRVSGRRKPKARKTNFDRFTQSLDVEETFGNILLFLYILKYIENGWHPLATFA